MKLQTYLVLLSMFFIYAAEASVTQFCKRRTYDYSTVQNFANQATEAIRVQHEKDALTIRRYEEIMSRNKNALRNGGQVQTISGESYDHVYQRLNNRMSGDCFERMYTGKIRDGINSECKPSEILRACNISFSNFMQNYNSRPKQLDAVIGSGRNRDIYCQAERYKSDAIQAIKKMRGEYQSCYEQWEANFIDNLECRGSLERAADAENLRLISRVCSEDSVVTSLRNFHEYLHADQGPLDNFCNVVDVYSKMRHLAIDYGEEVAKFIYNLDILKKRLFTTAQLRQPASLCPQGATADEGPEP